MHSDGGDVGPAAAFAWEGHGRAYRRSMAYSRSVPLRHWLDDRRDAIDALAAAHAAAGEVAGPGRPLEIGRPVAHAYVLRVVAEFQAFVRDLHDLMAERTVDLSKPDEDFRAILVGASTAGRAMDRGNANLRALEEDFRRLGLKRVGDKIAAKNPRWETVGSQRGDRHYYDDLIRLRNALAHGNQRQVLSLRQEGVLDTVTWTRGQLPMLNRTTRVLDRVVWEHIQKTFGVDPW